MRLSDSIYSSEQCNPTLLSAPPVLRCTVAAVRHPVFIHVERAAIRFHRAPTSLAQAFPICTPVRFVIHPWIATVIHRGK
jgi:hypothetical protein